MHVWTNFFRLISVWTKVVVKLADRQIDNTFPRAMALVMQKKPTQIYSAGVPKIQFSFKHSFIAKDILLMLWFDLSDDPIFSPRLIRNSIRKIGKKDNIRLENFTSEG